MKADRPWLWPVRIGEIDYGIPLTSSDRSAGYAGFIRCCYTATTGLNLHFMVPMPEEALRPQTPVPSYMLQELRYYREIEKYISAEADILRRLSQSGDMGRNFQNHSIDYNKIEQAYKYWYPGLNAGLFLSKKEDSMSISKNGQSYFTKDELEAARKNSSALEYARRQGYELIKENNYYRMKDHDSLVFKQDGTFFWNSRQVKGDAIDFQIHYEGKSMVDAVLTLAGPQQSYARPTAPERISPSPESNAPETVLEMPEKAITCRHIFGYLCGTRGLEKDVTREMVRQERLYQSTVTVSSGRELHNAVFVYKDPEGQVVGGFKRGTSNHPEFPAYKRAVYGSNKNYGWLLSAKTKTHTVCVFEAAIDAASHASLEAAAGKYWGCVDRLSLEGLNPTPLQKYLESHPETRNIKLMLDADGPGRAAAEQLAEKLQNAGYRVENLTPPTGKDWNDSLLAYRATEQQREAAAPAQEQPEFEQ